MVEVVVSKEFVDCHVDDFVFGVVDKFEETTGDALTTRDRPYSEFLGLSAGGFEMFKQFA